MPAEIRSTRWLSRVTATLVTATILAACAHTSTPAPGTRVAALGDTIPLPAGRDEACPIVVPNTQVVITDTAEGITLDLITTSGSVADLQRRAVNLAADYNALYDQPGPERHVRYVTRPVITQGGGYGVGGGQGSDEIPVPGRAASRALVEIAGRGARIHYVTESSVEATQVRRRVTEQAVQMWAGTCPSVR